MSDVVYLAGRPLDINGGKAWPGDEIDVSDVPYLESFISAGYIYRVANTKEGFEYLPPHMLAALKTREQAEREIFATDGVTNVADVAGEQAFEESDVYRRAEAQATVSQGRNSPRAQAKAAAYLADNEKKAPAPGPVKKEK